MAIKHLYFAIENLALNASQRSTLVTALQSLGARQNSTQPAERNHWRVRLDNDAAIFEAAFDEDNINQAAFINRLASLFGVDANDVSAVVTTPSYGTLVTLSYAATDYLRVLVFGGLSATWEQSRAQVLAYLAANRAAWETLDV